MTDQNGGAIRVVCFDLGGVVVRICRTWEEACRRAGVEVRDHERFSDPHLRAQRLALTDAYMAGRMTCEQYWQETARATGGLYAPHEIRAIHLAWTMEDYTGIAGVIDRLNATPGMTTACLSNTNHSHWEVLTVHAPSPAIGRLGRRLVSHHMGLLKPDEAIYRAAEAELGVGPSQVLFFDDREENIVGARACGWHAEQIDDERDTAAQITRHLRARGIWT